MTTPTDLTSKPLQVGDFVLYTLQQSGTIEFGVIEEIKGKPNKIKMRHTHPDGSTIYKSAWDSASKTFVVTDVVSTSWLNYTTPWRFLLMQPPI